MTTFTRIDENASPSITLQQDHPISNINPLIYGGFIEHMGRCIYGGIYDPDNAYGLVDEDGFRTDVMDCMRELRVPVMRYPGGNFVATYNWMDGVGPRENRPKRPELAWGSVESNQFGTDEFMLWCKKIGTEPYLALNMGTGTLQQALAWLEYCNSDKDTYYANLRRQNGHPEPYKVKYWALGNETWGPWQVEQRSKEDYAKMAYQWGKALKLLDPSITLILCGKNGCSDWDRYVLQQCLKVTDMHSIHLYTASSDHYKNFTAPKAAERAIEITAALIDLARNEVDQEAWPDPLDSRPRTVHRPTICFDEWNVWDPERAPGHKGAEETYDVSDMLAVAVWLNVFVRQSKYIGMATIAQSVNVISPLLTTPQGVVEQTTYWPLFLFSRYMSGRTLSCQLRSPAYDGPTDPIYLQSTMSLPLLDVSAARDEHDYISVAVVNGSKDRSFDSDLNLGPLPEKVRVFTVGGNSNGLHDTNTVGDGKVLMRESWWSTGQARKFTFEKHSLTLLRWKSDITLPIDSAEHQQTDGRAPARL